MRFHGVFVNSEFCGYLGIIEATGKLGEDFVFATGEPFETRRVMDGASRASPSAKLCNIDF